MAIYCGSRDTLLGATLRSGTILFQEAVDNVGLVRVLLHLGLCRDVKARVVKISPPLFYYLFCYFVRLVSMIHLINPKRQVHRNCKTDK